MLAAIVAASSKKPLKEGNWISASMLFAYAIAFSLAYIGLKAGTGALLLFGSVQATMILVSIFAGQTPRLEQWVGLLLAVGGLVYLVAPGLAAPPLQSALLMVGAGVAWGIYSIRGKGVSDPTGVTAGNFVRAAPMALVPLAFYANRLHYGQTGVLLALASGALTSGLGYVFWYAVLPDLGSIRAAIIQLMVPILAALAGALVLHEALTQRLLVAGAVTLVGVAMAVFGGAASAPRSRTAR